LIFGTINRKFQLNLFKVLIGIFYHFKQCDNLNLNES
jgi:hypothetical protein